MLWLGKVVGKALGSPLRELSTVRLPAAVSPSNAEVTWLVDGAPIARVGYPHSLYWPLSVGTHTIRAAVADSPEVSAPIIITVHD